jgi:hypothetical protein
MSTIVMTKKENLKYEGKKYIAISPLKSGSCHGCVFSEMYCGGAHCLPQERKDGRNVIFVLKTKKEKAT